MRAALALAFAFAACGGGQAFTLSATDNDPAALARALAAAAPARGRSDLVYLALADGKLAAWSPARKTMVWSVPAQVGSRVVPCGSFVALREGDALVGRDVADGRLIWSQPAAGLVGLAGDADRAYAVSQAGGAWRARAIDRDGRELWHTDSDGRLGAPAARGGLLYLPFLEQWLNILDGASGKPLARLRREDQAVAWVRATPDGVFFGARAVVAVDDAAASGRLTPGRHAPLPPAVFARFPNLLGHYDAYTPLAAYGARDRVRLLWSAAAGPPVAFRDGVITLLAQRAFFGVDAATGDVRWARLLPRGDVVSAEDTGGGVMYVTGDGQLGVIDRRSGAAEEQGLGGRVLGATFDADLAPPAAVEPRPEAELAAIALDRDARLPAMKLFAVEALARREGAGATEALLRILADEGAAGDVVHAAGEALVASRDPAGAPLLVAALGVHSDQVSGKQARGVDVLARALAARGAGVPGAVEALVGHLEDPATPEAVRRAVAAALATLGDREAVPPLASFLLLHRCDPRWAGSVAAVTDALAALGEREVLRHVAGDDTTAPAVTAHIAEVLK